MSLLSSAFEPDAEALRVLAEEYFSESKALPYVGNIDFMEGLKPKSRGWYNSLAVFPNYGREAMHGEIGVSASGEPLWIPKEMPEPIDSPAVRRRLLS